ncbi:cation:proton antiporter [Streptomyces sp. NPDC000229]|uniref:cation:proton antiporter n=1 Tax=Streptomyces sp. NPDC000229 TaxID=3154247 RepID=UPI00331A973C
MTSSPRTPPPPSSGSHTPAASPSRPVGSGDGAPAGTVPGRGGGKGTRRLWGPLGVVAAGAAVLVLTGLFSGGPGTLWDDPLTRFLLALTVVLCVSHLFGELLRRIGQPPVVGEILGGLMLGPSVLGALWPAATDLMFPPAVLAGLDKVAQLGLVVFMFLIGSEVRIERARNQGPLGAVLAGSMALPFLCGTGLALAFAPHLSGDTTSTRFALFFGLAVSITAVPVLARILVDLGLDRTRAGSVSMTCAALGDGLAWLVLTVLLTGSPAGGGGHLLKTVVWVAALVALTYLGVRPLLGRLFARAPSERLLAVVLIAGAVGWALLTQVMHLHPVIGAFLFGTAVPRDVPAVERVVNTLRGFTMLVLLPVFFAGVGVRTSLGAFGSEPGIWLLFAAVLVVAQVSKVVGAGGAARLAGMTPRESWQIGVLMNCRGVTELIVATIGHQAGLINDLCFTMLVLLAMTTTALTGVVVPRLGRDPVPDASGGRSGEVHGVTRTSRDSGP